MRRLLLVATITSSCAAIGCTPQSAGGRYQVNLKSGSFTPPAGVSAAAIDRLEARIVANADRGLPPRTYALVQFYEKPSLAERQDLEGDGIVLLEWISSTTWRASVEQDGVSRLESSSAVRWAGTIQPRQKTTPDVLTGDIAAYERRDAGRLAYVVTFQPDVPQNLAERVVGDVGGDISFASGEFESIGAAEVVIDRESLETLLAEDVVVWVSRASPPVMEYGLRAQRVVNVPSLRRSPWNLRGNGQVVGVWDASAFVEHGDLAGRVTRGDDNVAERGHPTAVAGAIAGDGSGNPDAEGMAPAAHIHAFDWNDDFAEMRRAATNPVAPGLPSVRISNHSYGAVLGWAVRGACRPEFLPNQGQFGRYTNVSRALDAIVSETNLVVVQAAGNEKADRNPERADDPDRPPDCRQTGDGPLADCLPPRAVAKNVIAVGAWGRTRPAPFSSAGPTDDGRVKPDVMAPGVDFLTTAPDVNEDQNCDGIDDYTEPYRTASGTSLASPVVAGVVALLREHASSRGLDFNASTYKALLVNSAGSGQPSFSGGWGLIDAENALYQLAHPTEPCVQEQVITTEGRGGAVEIPFTVAENQRAVSVTIAWTDPPAAADSAATLQNDIDLELIAPDSSVQGPWLLDPSRPAASAVRASTSRRDRVNNVERVTVSRPTPGAWTARIQAFRLVSGAQRVSIVGVCSDPDIDNDGWITQTDNCPGHYNPFQENIDGDGDGDACDSDIDGDGVPNVADVCRTVGDGDQIDTDGDGMGDACDPDDDNDCVADTRDNCSTVRNCNYFGLEASKRLCDDPCGTMPQLALKELAGIAFNTCAVDPVLPENCFSDGCPWPAFRQNLGVDPRTVLDRVLAEYPEEVIGGRLMDEGRVRLPATAGGYAEGLPVDVGRFLGRGGGLGRATGGAFDGPSSWRSVGYVPLTMIPNPMRDEACVVAIRRLVAPDVGAVLSSYNACRDRHRAEADACQLDSDGNGVGDVCEP